MLSGLVLELRSQWTGYVHTWQFPEIDYQRDGRLRKPWQEREEALAFGVDLPHL